MEDLLIRTLEKLGYPVSLQGSMAEGEAYPESFFTFWENPSDDVSFYDDNPTREVYNFDVNFYSTDPELVYTALKEAKKLLKENGFSVPGSGHTVGSDEPTHTGRGMTAIITKKQED